MRIKSTFPFSWSSSDDHSVSIDVMSSSTIKSDLFTELHDSQLFLEQILHSRTYPYVFPYDTSYVYPFVFWVPSRNKVLASLDKSSESEAYIIQTMYEDFNDQFISLRIFLLYESVHFSFVISSYLRHSVEHKGKLISMEVIR